MENNMLRVLLACLLMVGTAAKAGDIERDLDAIVQSYGKVGIFAGAVQVAHDGKTVYEVAVGLANRETNVPNRANTRFNIGSIGKTFTSVAILQLAEAGKLKLSDPISRFLPDIPYWRCARHQCGVPPLPG
jgi:CubicO group peptidase (beta-lactamase class C family)